MLIGVAMGPALRLTFSAILALVVFMATFLTGTGRFCGGCIEFANATPGTQCPIERKI
jgi:hypothetical protein